MNEAIINHAAINVISDLIDNLYDFCGTTEQENNYRLITLGEINGIINLVDALKNEMKKGEEAVAKMVENFKDLETRGVKN